MPVVTTITSVSSPVLKLATETSFYGLAVTPKINDTLLDLQQIVVQCDVYKTSAAAALVVGVMTDPEDLYTFVPVDTVGVTDFYVECNRLGLQIKYASEVLDGHTGEMSAAKTMAAFDQLIDRLDIERGFLKFAESNHVTPKDGEWERSREFMLTQVKALIARYTPMGDDAFYPIYYQTDRLIQIAVENETHDSGVD